MIVNIIDQLEERDLAVWTTDSYDTEHILVTADSNRAIRAQVVSGEKDNDVVHVQEDVVEVSSLDVVFVMVDNGTLVIDAAKVNNTRPSIPLGRPTAVNPRWLDDWDIDDG